MNALLILVVCVFPLMSVGKNDSKSDLKQIQGDWVGVDDNAKIRVTFDKDKCDFRSAATGEWYQATIDLDSDSNPKGISATITDNPVKNFNGLVSLGLYRLSENRLTLAGCRPGDPEAPKDFDDPRCRTVELKRP